MVGTNDGVLTLKAEGNWLPGMVEIVHQDKGYSSGENSLHEGINDEQLVRVGSVFWVLKSFCISIGNQLVVYIFYRNLQCSTVARFF